MSNLQSAILILFYSPCPPCLRGKNLLCSKESAQDIVPAMRQETLRMKLHAEQRVLAMCNPHDLPIPARLLRISRHLEFFRQRIGLNHQAMVSRRLKWVLQPGKQTLAIMVDHV